MTGEWFSLIPWKMDYLLEGIVSVVFAIGLYLMKVSMPEHVNPYLRTNPNQKTKNAGKTNFWVLLFGILISLFFVFYFAVGINVWPEALGFFVASLGVVALGMIIYIFWPRKNND